jgi:multidrug resistance efflux pump
LQVELEQVQEQAELEQVQAELEQVQAELEQVQAELELAPAQFHDQTISDAPLLREIYDVGQKMAWHLAAPLLAQAA